MIAQHRVVPAEVDEVRDPPKRRLGLEDQVLVADLDVVAELLRLAAGLADPPLPKTRHPGRVLLLAHPVPDRQRDVAAVADHVDEVGLGHRALEPAHLANVDRRLVAPARLVVALGVEGEEVAQRVPGREVAMAARRLSSSAASRPKSPQRFFEEIHSAVSAASSRPSSKRLTRRTAKCVSGGIAISRMGVQHQAKRVVPERPTPTMNGAGGCVAAARADRVLSSSEQAVSLAQARRCAAS